MASISAATFINGEVSDDDSDYIDIVYSDRSKNSHKREWTLTFIKNQHDRIEGRAAYSVLLRTDTRLQNIKMPIKPDTPRKIVAALIVAAKRDGLL